MAGVQLTCNLDDAAFGEMLRAIYQATGDLSKPLREIGEEARALSMEAFESESSPGGEDWEPSQRALNTGGQTLSDTGALKGSVDVAVFPKEVRVGSNLVYAAIHQFGGDAGRNHAVHLPARPYLPTADDLNQGYVYGVLQKHLARALR